MSKNEIVQSESAVGRRTVDVTIVSAIVAVGGLMAAAASGIL